MFYHTIHNNIIGPERRVPEQLPKCFDLCQLVGVWHNSLNFGIMYILSNNTFFETRTQWLFDGLIFVEKGLGPHTQRMLEMSRFYTLTEILSKLSVASELDLQGLAVG